ncbi:protein-methionine-sulfoxide reductase catalytic subunit MsrP [Candidatus Entotheonella palauensis]|nr:protein-methionine-sulfoxide reductase catalytic subunit MsrP [Candidatus Entotheonella palauensis]
MHYHPRPAWAIPEHEATPESVFFNRRAFLKGSLGAAAGGVVGVGSTLTATAEAADKEAPKDQTLDMYPAKRNPAFTLDRPLTNAEEAAKFNNFYEFGPVKTISLLAQRLNTRPWTVKVHGLVNKPKTFDIDDLIRSMPLEERLYRFRCVEAWAMAVPWTGFPLAELIKRVEPASEAKYIKMTTFVDRSVALNQLRFWYPWPYTEALTIEEGMNELTLLATGIYGKPMPKQHGAPIRLVVPWKYGFKNIKSIVAIEFVKERPKTFWEELGPNEYGFWANVNPNFSHPRWSQAEERMLGTDEKRATLIFNGYETWVASMYPDLKNRLYFM